MSNNHYQSVNGHINVDISKEPTLFGEMRLLIIFIIIPLEFNMQRENVVNSSATGN